MYCRCQTVTESSKCPYVKSVQNVSVASGVSTTFSVEGRNLVVRLLSLKFYFLALHDEVSQLLYGVNFS